MKIVVAPPYHCLWAMEVDYGVVWKPSNEGTQNYQSMWMFDRMICKVFHCGCQTGFLTNI